MPTNNNGMKVRVFRFLDLNWTEILTGELLINSVDKVIQIRYQATSTSNDHLIPDCIPNTINSEQKCIQISVSRLSKIEQDEGDRKIIYMWVDVNPFSFSFLTEDKASQACQILQLIEENREITENFDKTQEITTVEYIQSLIKSNPAMLSTMFNNSNVEVVDVLLRLLEHALTTEISTYDKYEKQYYFHILMLAVRVPNKKIIEELLKEKNYPLLLTALSWNPFNVKPFDYLAEYSRMVNFNNILGITDKIILNTYQLNAKIKFLRDVAACMFIEIENQRIFQNMLNNNNQIILERISSSQQILEQIVIMSTKDPKGYLSVYTELWEIIKVSNFEYETKHIKDNFINKFIQKDLHNCVIKAAYAILKDTELKATVDSRFHEKWIQALNPFISYDWQFSQKWICSKKDSNSLLYVLHKIVSESKDEGLIQSTLNFVRWFIEPTDNRMLIPHDFRCYVYNQFIEKVWDSMKNSCFLIQIYVDFVIKLYRVEMIRTRRMMIENKFMEDLDKLITKKSMLICIIKLLDEFLDGFGPEIFVYLTNHELFKGLAQQYIRNKQSRNIVNSCFRSMCRKIQSSTKPEIREYFNSISFPVKPIPI